MGTEGAEITPFPEIPRQQVPGAKEGLKGKSRRAFLDCTSFHLGPGKLCALVSGCPDHLENVSQEEDVWVGWKEPPGIYKPHLLLRTPPSATVLTPSFHLPLSSESGSLANMTQRLLEISR